MANRTPVKLIELSGESWMGGISLQPTLPVGGIFKTANNFDPFNKIGVFQPSTRATQQGSSTVTAGGYFNIGFEESGLSYFYSFGNNTKVYKVSTFSPFGDVDDVSAQISDITVIRGATKFKDRAIYASNTSIKANTIPLAIGSQVGLLSVTSGGVHIMKVAPDRNLYATNINSVARITSVSGTSGNSAAYLTFESDVVLRDLESDGEYLVIAGDTNELVPAGTNTNTRCFVAFWNMKSQDLTRIWEFEDFTIYGIKFTGEEIVVFGRDNIYTCSVNSSIRPLMPMRGNTNLTFAVMYAGGIVRRSGSVLFGMGSNVYAYGRPSHDLKKIFYHPYSIDSGGIISLFSDGNSVFAMTDDNKLWDFSSGADVTSSILTLCDVDFKSKYEFAYAKVNLTAKLASGDSVLLQILTGDGDIILTEQEFTFATHGAVSTHIFPPKTTAGAGALIFEDATSFRLTSTNGARVRRVEIWGYPVDPAQDSSY